MPPGWPPRRPRRRRRGGRVLPTGLGWRRRRSRRWRWWLAGAYGSDRSDRRGRFSPHVGIGRCRSHRFDITRSEAKNRLLFGVARTTASVLRWLARDLDLVHDPARALERHRATRTASDTDA